MKNLTANIILITDELKIQQALKAEDLLGAMQEFDQWLYATRKWGLNGQELTAAEEQILPPIFEAWRSALQDRDINLEKLYP